MQDNRIHVNSNKPKSRFNECEIVYILRRSPTESGESTC